MIHIAGNDIHIGPYVRQRCAWCGATLIDYNLDRIAAPAGQEGGPSWWPVGDLIAVDGNASWVVDHTDGDPLPVDSCTRIDTEVTA